MPDSVMIRSNLIFHNYIIYVLYKVNFSQYSNITGNVFTGAIGCCSSLRQQRFSAVVPCAVPLPASSDAGQAAVHAGQENQQLEHEHDRREHEAEHVAWRSVPFIGGGSEKAGPSVQVGVQGAEEERQVPQLGLEDRESYENSAISSFKLLR